jgi:SAM-dependent methyltransferase
VERESWDERYSGPELVWGAGPNRFVVELLADLPPGRGLDLATGEGRNAIWLAERGWQMTAVDFSAVGLARAAGLAAERGVRVDWVGADLRDYQPAAGHFDLVLIAYLHLRRPDLGHVLGTASAALVPGGTLLVVGHDLENLDHGIGGPQDPGLLYTPESVVAALPELAVRMAERRLRPVASQQGERAAVDTLVRAVRQGEHAGTPAEHGRVAAGQGRDR